MCPVYQDVLILGQNVSCISRCPDNYILGQYNVSCISRCPDIYWDSIMCPVYQGVLIYIGTV